MRINNNISALNTLRQYTTNTNNANAAMAKLSSGLRINSAADDAAGLAISEKMRAQIKGTEMASKNSQDAISMVQTAEGALSETTSILQRMRELAVQSSSDTNENTDRTALQSEFTQLTSEIDDISSQTKFNNMNLLDGTLGSSVDATSSILSTTGVTSAVANGTVGTTYDFADDGTNLTITRDLDGDSSTTDDQKSVTMNTTADGAQTVSVADWGLNVKLDDTYTAAGLDGANITMNAPTGQLTIQTGASQGETMDISINAMDSKSLGITSSVTIDTSENASSAITSVDNALQTVSSQRANLGAYQNRMDHKINNLSTSSENLTAAESRIRDVDMAAEMVEFTKNNILMQAAQSMLAQANSQPQGVLQLLK